MAVTLSVKFKQDVMELFAGRYDMDVDLVGPNTEIPSMVKYDFHNLSQIVLSHQSVAFEKMPLEYRFNIAMKFEQETPADFLKAVGLTMGTQLVSLTDSQGATVLHWAGRKWATLEHARPSVRTMCAEFVSGLIKAGSLVSAFDNLGLSPLIYMMGSLSPNSDGWPWYYHFCSYPDLVDLVGFWGRTLAGAGVPLREYIKTENSLLKALQPRYRVKTHFRYRCMVFNGLRLASDETLTTIFKMVGTVCVYTRAKPPGAYVYEMDMLPRLCLGSFPPHDDELWQQISTRDVMSTAFTLDPNEDSLVEAEFEMDKILFKGTQDDHGTITAIFHRNEQRLQRERDAMPSRHRSSSTPPAARRFVEYSTCVWRSAVLRDPQTGLSYECQIYAHKCPYDSQWGFNAEDVYPHDHEMWRSCMKGCRGRPDHAADIRDHLKHDVFFDS